MCMECMSNFLLIPEDCPTMYSRISAGRVVGFLRDGICLARYTLDSPCCEPVYDDDVSLKQFLCNNSFLFQKAKNEFFDKMKNFEADLELARQDNEDLEEAKENLEKELSKAKNDISMWKKRFEEEGQAKAEELETARRKIAAKLAETEEELAAALSKANSAEKAKQRLAGEVEDLNVELDKVSIVEQDNIVVEICKMCSQQACTN